MGGGFLGLVAILAGLGFWFSITGATKNHTNRDLVLNSAQEIQVFDKYGRLPLYFIENQGQKDHRVKYYAQNGAQTIWFTEEGITFTLQKGKKAEAGKFVSPKLDKLAESDLRGRHQEKYDLPGVVRMTPMGIKKQVDITALEPQESKVNYFIGNDPAKWRTNIPTYKTVVYKEAYPGIDLKFYGNGRQMEYDVVVKPGADPDQVRFQYAGITSLEVTHQGDLALTLPDGGVFLQKKPIVYQEIGGIRISRDGKFKVYNETAQLSYGFELAAYDNKYPLIIDPTLVYSTFLGGRFVDYGIGIAVDNNGNAYVTGVTNSDDFPVEKAIFPVNPFWHSSAFITKISASGTEIIYSTYIGGSGTYNWSNGIALDSMGNAYITGWTSSNDFPTKNPLFPSYSGSNDAFITKISADGSELIYSTYLGGTDEDIAKGIAVDNSGSACITGYTCSLDFPLSENPLGQRKGLRDAFITKINFDGTSLTFSTYLGGALNEEGSGISIDNNGNIYITGYTESFDFPISNALFPTKKDRMGGAYWGVDAFVTKINNLGTSFVYSTYLGGTDGDVGLSICADSEGNAYVTGVTDSCMNNHDFPTVPNENYFGGPSLDGTCGFVTKINNSGSSLIYSGYLFKGHRFVGNAIALDSNNNAFIYGVYIDYQENYSNQNIALIKIDSSGLNVLSSVIIGSYGTDYAESLAIDTADNVYLTGYTSTSNLFEELSGNPVRPFAGYEDAFVIKFSDVPPNRPPLANAGQDQTKHVGQLVTLDGSGSSDPDGQSLTYVWSFLSRPQGSNAALSDASAVNPTFVPDLLGTYVLQLVVTDSLNLASVPDEVVISTTNTIPVANAGPDQAISLIGSTVYLNGMTQGQESFDEDGDNLTFQWTLVSKPQDSRAALVGSETATPSFVADEHGTYEARLVVRDSWEAVSQPDVVIISFTNIKPVANAGASQSVVVGDTVNLNGSGSRDANGDALTYQWSFTSKPEGSFAALANPDTAQTTFVPDLPGLYVVQLVVKDGFEGGVSAPSTAQILVVSQQTEIIQRIQNLISVIGDPGMVNNLSFKNVERRNTLINKLNSVIANIEVGSYGDALGQLQHDILAKTDGCASGDTPDKNDWIKDCDAQTLLYHELREIIAKLQEMM
jgi:hypothetical protein